MQRRADNNKHFASCSFKQHLLLTWSAYVKRSAKPPCVLQQTLLTKYKQQTTLCRVVRCGLKITYTVIKQLVIFVLCVDEIFLFDFQIVYLAHSLAAAASKCQYISYNVANLAEPWSARSSCSTRGVYFRTPSHLWQRVTAAITAYTCTSNLGMRT